MFPLSLIFLFFKKPSPSPDMGISLFNELLVPCWTDRRDPAFTEQAWSVSINIACNCSVYDLNLDGVINTFDASRLLADWGNCSSTGALGCLGGCRSDYNNDNIVNSFDLLQILSRWDQACP